MSECQHNHGNSSVFNKIVPANQKVASVLLKNAEKVKLTFDQRQELPHDLLTESGKTVFCHIHDPVEAGDRLISSDNHWLVIEAAEEELFEVPADHPNFIAFVHIAGLNMWPLELTEKGHARVIASHECMHMLEHLDLPFSKLNAPLRELNVPEVKHHDCCGHDHDHDHKHEHDHKHAHDHEHEHKHEHKGPEGHSHGPDCGHQH